MKKYVIGLVLVVLLLLMKAMSPGLYPFAKSYKPSVADLIGGYSSNTPPEKWYLSLNGDGTYKQVVYSSSGVKIKNSGKWELECPDYESGCSVYLVNSIIYPDVPSMGLSKGDWDIEVQRTSSGRPRLIINDDQDAYFAKLE